jgi:hypothetical protein
MVTIFGEARLLFPGFLVGAGLLFQYSATSHIWLIFFIFTEIIFEFFKCTTQ